MQPSDIAWTDYTWNPTHGCSKIEPPDGESGCTNCYAERLSRRYNHTDHEWTNEYAEENVQTKPGKLDEPASITAPAPEDWSTANLPAGNHPLRVFVNSMSDLFHSQVPDEFVQKVFGSMRNCPHHVFQILTKRPGRAAHMALDWPPNVWIGTSVEDDRVTERIDLLRDCNAETLFISFEPLIGPVGKVDLSGIDWAIVGGESGPDADRREMNHAWARALLEQCRRDGIAFFFKQSSARRPGQGTALTVYNPEFDIYEQREIRELPDPAEAVVKAQKHTYVDTESEL
jgi:protein gp37